MQRTHWYLPMSMAKMEAMWVWVVVRLVVFIRSVKGNLVMWQPVPSMQRIALSVMLAVVSWLAIASPPARADDNENAAALIIKLGGTAKRDNMKPGSPIVAVNLEASKVTDAALKEVGRLKRLEILKLSSIAVSDAGLKALAPLAGLKELDLCNTKVTDAGLKNRPQRGLRKVEKIIA